VVVSHDPNQRRAAYWDKQAARYDRAMNFWDRHLFGVGQRRRAAIR
jgi:hypothetical protein